MNQSPHVRLFLSYPCRGRQPIGGLSGGFERKMRIPAARMAAAAAVVGQNESIRTRGLFAKYQGLCVHIWIATINRDPKVIYK
jgi:hypothetical protein